MNCVNGKNRFRNGSNYKFLRYLDTLFEEKDLEYEK